MAPDREYPPLPSFELSPTVKKQLQRQGDLLGQAYTACVRALAYVCASQEVHAEAFERFARALDSALGSLIGLGWSKVPSARGDPAHTLAFASIATMVEALAAARQVWRASPARSRKIAEE